MSYVELLVFVALYLLWIVALLRLIGGGTRRRRDDRVTPPAARTVR